MERINFLKSNYKTILSFILGIILTLVAIGKIFLYSEFLNIISHNILFSTNSAKILSFIIISFEIIFGLLLILKYYKKYIFISICLLIGIVLSIIFISVVIPKNIYSRDILDYNFLIQGIFIFYIIIFNISGFLAVSYTASKTVRINKYINTFVNIILVIVIIYLEIGLIMLIINPNDKKPLYNDITVFLNEIKSIGYLSQNIDYKRLIVILNTSDYNCPPCLDDIILFNNLINKNLNSFDQGKIYCFIYQEVDDSLNIIRMNRLSDILKISYKCEKVDSKMMKIILKSTAIVIDSSGEIVYTNKFPMGATEHRKILELILS